MKQWLRFFGWIAFLAMCITIFVFSHQPAEQSAKVSKTVVHEVLCKVVAGYAEMASQEQASQIADYHKLIRSIAHFCLYFLWGISFGYLLKLYGFCGKKLWLAGIVGGFVYAVCDEIHQMFSAGRSAQAVDVLLDSLGVLAGLGCLWLIGFIYTRVCRKQYFKKNN